MRACSSLIASSWHTDVSCGTEPTGARELTCTTPPSIVMRRKDYLRSFSGIWRLGDFGAIAAAAHAVPPHSHRAEQPMTRDLTSASAFTVGIERRILNSARMLAFS